MADDYYQILGVDKNASQADIQKAYRTLARKYHPDLHPDDKTAKEKFLKVQGAFDVLNDTSKRELYDRYGSAFESAAAGGGPGAGPGPRGGQTWYTQGSPGGYEEIDFGQMFGDRFGQEGGGGGGGGSPFADLFGGFQRAAQAAGKGKRGRAAAEQRGPDLQSEIEVPFQTAIQGGKVEVGVQRGPGKTDRMEVKIPAGITDRRKNSTARSRWPGRRQGTSREIYC